MHVYIIHDVIVGTSELVFEGALRAALERQFPECPCDLAHDVRDAVKDLADRTEREHGAYSQHLGVAVHVIECEADDLVHPHGHVVKVTNANDVFDQLHTLRIAGVWADMPSVDAIGTIEALTDAMTRPCTWSTARSYALAASRLGFQIAR